MITHFNGDYYMSSNGLFCGVNAPPAKDKSSGGGLPPYSKCKAFLTDDYKCVPKNWMGSSGRIGSYFVGVNDNSGLWLDFNRNSQHTHEVAIVISIQGVNPITGLPCKDAQLEQYIDDCPKCKTKFKANRYCETCGYNWPKQNYISTTAQPNGELWLDGFRAADGIIRQWIFSEDEKRGVASNIINEDRVFAIGISFFLSKEKKRNQPSVMRSGFDHAIHFVPVQTPTFYSNNTGSVNNLSFYNTVSSTLGTKSLGTKSSSKGTKCGKSLSQAKANAISNFKSWSDAIDPNQGATMDWMELPDRSITLEPCPPASPAFAPAAQAADDDNIANMPINYGLSCNEINVLSSEESRARRPGLYDSTKVFSRKGAVPDIITDSPATTEEIAAVQEQLAQTANDPNLTISCGCHFAMPSHFPVDWQAPAKAVDVTKLEVAAGNEINQKIHDDPETLDFWRNEPESIIVVNYGFDKEIKQIIAGGKNVKTVKKEGFLAEIPVGN